MHKEQEVASRLSRAAVHLVRSTELGTQNLHAELFADLSAAVSAAAVDNDDLIWRKREQRLQCWGNNMFFIQDRDNDGDFRLTHENIPRVLSRYRLGASHNHGPSRRYTSLAHRPAADRRNPASAPSSHRHCHQNRPETRRKGSTPRGGLFVSTRRADD